MAEKFKHYEVQIPVILQMDVDDGVDPKDVISQMTTGFQSNHTGANIFSHSIGEPTIMEL